MDSPPIEPEDPNRPLRMFASLSFVALVTFYLLTEHLQHTLGALPWVILLACPLLHVFMHRGHGHGGHGSHGGHEAHGGDAVPPPWDPENPR